MRLKLEEVLDSILDGHDPIAAIVESETAHGFKVVRPGDVPWFLAADWQPASIASVTKTTVRLVLLHAIVERAGAFTRTCHAILGAGLIPTVIDPVQEFSDTLRRWRWRPKTTWDETVWRPPLRKEPWLMIRIRGGRSE